MLNASLKPIGFDMLTNKILWRLSFRHQLKDWVFCAVYQTSELLGWIPDGIKVVITIAKLHSTKPEFSLCTGSNQRHISGFQWSEPPTIDPAGNKAECLF